MGPRGPKLGSFHLDKRATDLIKQIDDGDDLLTSKQVCGMLKVSDQWIEQARFKGSGPLFILLGPRLIRYRRSDVRAWLRSRATQREDA
jgi:predicted DNA-binding transcriptional regulator AlpA